MISHYIIFNLLTPSTFWYVAHSRCRPLQMKDLPAKLQIKTRRYLKQFEISLIEK